VEFAGLAAAAGLAALLGLCAVIAARKI